MENTKLFKINLALLFAITSLTAMSCAERQVGLKEKELSQQTLHYRYEEGVELYDEAYEIEDGIEYKLINPHPRLKSSYEFYTPVVMNEAFIYPGSVLSASYFEEGKLIKFGNELEYKDSVRISFSFPSKSCNIRPTLSGLRDALVTATTNHNFSGKQSQRFTYRFKQIYKYDELKIAFGANVALGTLFSVKSDANSINQKYNTALYVDFSQTYFNVIMDFPYDGNIFKTVELRNKYLKDEPIYVNLINYGRKGIILAESTASYKELSIALRAAFKAKVVNGDLQLDVKNKKILMDANIAICIIGGFGSGQAETVKGYPEFVDYIVQGGNYSSEAYGVPISFSAAYAKDNSMFISRINI